MSQPYRPGRSPFRHGRGALALGVGLAAISAPAALASEGVRWQLHASVPVICAILEVETRADQPTGVAVATSCNAERYQLTLTGAPSLRAARSSAGPVLINGSAVTITSARPGYALTTIELAEPVTGEQIAVSVQPL